MYNFNQFSQELNELVKQHSDRIGLDVYLPNGQKIRSKEEVKYLVGGPKGFANHLTDNFGPEFKIVVWNRNGSGFSGKLAEMQVDWSDLVDETSQEPSATEEPAPTPTPAPMAPFTSVPSMPLAGAPTPAPVPQGDPTGLTLHYQTEAAKWEGKYERLLEKHETFKDQWIEAKEKLKDEINRLERELAVKDDKHNLALNGIAQDKANTLSGFLSSDDGKEILKELIGGVRDVIAEAKERRQEMPENSGLQVSDQMAPYMDALLAASEGLDEESLHKLANVYYYFSQSPESLEAAYNKMLAASTQATT